MIGKSIYGNKFADEKFDVKHDRPGLLSMANSGPNTNGSQFFITFKAYVLLQIFFFFTHAELSSDCHPRRTPHLNGKHVVFGEITEGKEILKTIETNPAGSRDVPKLPVKIEASGQL